MTRRKSLLNEAESSKGNYRKQVQDGEVQQILGNLAAHRRSFTDWGQDWASATELLCLQ